MCWRSNKTPVKQIADEDIPIFKVLYINSSDRLISIFQDFEYCLGTKYSTKIGDIDNDFGYYAIDEGFHSYSEDYKVAKEEDSLLVFHNDDEGEKLYVVRFPLKVENGITTVVEGVIPKGSEYYLNKGEYVSNQIILNTLVNGICNS